MTDSTDMDVCDGSIRPTQVLDPKIIGPPRGVIGHRRSSRRAHLKHPLHQRRPKPHPWFDRHEQAPRQGPRGQRIVLVHSCAENATRLKVLVTVMELMMMVGLVLVCSRVLPENTFEQWFPDNVHTCPRTFLGGDSTCGSFRFHHKVTYGEGYRGHCKSPSDGGRHTKNLKSGPLRARGLRDLLQAGV